MTAFNIFFISYMFALHFTHDSPPSPPPHFPPNFLCFVCFVLTHWIQSVLCIPTRVGGTHWSPASGHSARESQLSFQSSHQLSRASQRGVEACEPLPIRSGLLTSQTLCRWEPQSLCVCNCDGPFMSRRQGLALTLPDLCFLESFCLLSLMMFPEPWGEGCDTDAPCMAE